MFTKCFTKKFVIKTFVFENFSDFDLEGVIEDTRSETVWTFDFVDKFIA